MKQPSVGIGVIIQNEAGQILVGKRKGSHAAFHSIPGGHLEMGETFEAAASREIWEETGLKIKNPKVFCVSNNLETFRLEGIHFVSVNLLAESYEGEPRVMEVEKCEGWEWVDPRHLPQPHFDASTHAVRCFLNRVFY